MISFHGYFLRFQGLMAIYEFKSTLKRNKNSCIEVKKSESYLKHFHRKLSSSIDCCDFKVEINIKITIQN